MEESWPGTEGQKGEAEVERGREVQGEGDWTCSLDLGGEEYGITVE